MKPISQYEDYFVSEDGRVYSTKWVSKKELKQFEHKGYRRVALSKNNKRRMFPVHRLVAEAFLTNPDNRPYVNHLDGNKRNNHVSNLAWCTRAENQEHSRNVLGNTGLGSKNSHYGYRNAKLYPNEELRNRLVELGIPRYKHNLAELGEMLPKSINIPYKNGNKRPSEHYVHFYHSETMNTWQINYVGNSYHRPFMQAETEADARAKMLIYLIENKLINTPELAVNKIEPPRDNDGAEYPEQY